jgi:hypothetical protein
MRAALVFFRHALRVQQGQLRLAPGFGSRLTRTPPPDEFRHQPAGGPVTNLSMARQEDKVFVRSACQCFTFSAI